MRPSRRSSPPYATRWVVRGPSLVVLLVAIQAGLFAAQWLLGWIEQDRLATGDWLVTHLALDPARVLLGEWWRLLTCGLLHAGPLHLLGNLLLLIFAGREIDPILGRRQVAVLFFGGNLAGAVTQVFLMPDFPMMGTSAGVAALLAAYATVLPEIEIEARLCFLVPMRLRVKFIALGVLAIAAACAATLTLPQIGPAGIIAAVLLGWLHARRLGFGRPYWWQRRLHARRQRRLRLDLMDAHQFVAEEIDPILEKIAREGIATLTRAERRILAQGREKIAASGSPL